MSLRAAALQRGVLQAEVGVPWIEVEFKEKRVWAEADASGELVVSGGRVPIRYSPAPGAKIYSGGAARVSKVSGAAPKELPPGQSADEAPARPSARGSGFGSAGTRTQAQAAAARQSAARQMEALPEGSHVAWTDGSCRGNPGPAGAGAVVRLADGRVLEEGRYLGRATNNVGELTAVALALDLMEGAGVDKADRVTLFTDSQYAFGVLCKGWKAKANTELILGIRQRLRAWKNLEVRWIAGHVGIPENERADALASGAIANR